MYDEAHTHARSPLYDPVYEQRFPRRDAAAGSVYSLLLRLAGMVQESRRRRTPPAHSWVLHTSNVAQVVSAIARHAG